MRKVRWSITNNGHKGKDYKEYDSTTYRCTADDTWLTIEVPVKDKQSKKAQP